MTEAEIAALLSVENGTRKISSLVPKILVDRMMANYRKKVGAVREHGLMSAALFYFAARGVLSYESEEQEGDGSRLSAKRAAPFPPRSKAHRP